MNQANSFGLCIINLMDLFSTQTVLLTILCHQNSFPLNDTEIQCANNRADLLCGACKEGYSLSLVLGTSQCREYTNSHLVWLVLFAVMGVALVILLFVCKLTMVEGTLSGLCSTSILLESIVPSFYHAVESTDAFSVFIVWLNPDFGIALFFLMEWMLTAKHGCNLCSLYMFGC